MALRLLHHQPRGSKIGEVFRRAACPCIYPSQAKASLKIPLQLSVIEMVTFQMIQHLLDMIYSANSVHTIVSCVRSFYPSSSLKQLISWKKRPGECVRLLGQQVYLDVVIEARPDRFSDSHRFHFITHNIPRWLFKDEMVGDGVIPTALSCSLRRQDTRVRP